MADAPNCANDRRSGERTTTVFRQALLKTEVFSGFCLVRNLSQNGMMAQTYVKLVEGAQLEVQFTDEIAVRGAVIWSTENAIGVRFDDPIDVQSVLSGLTGSGSAEKPSRAPRLAMKASGHIIHQNQCYPIALQDISMKGAKVRGAFLRPGDEPILCLEGLEPKKVVVRWIRLGFAGLIFVRPLSFEQLSGWVIARQMNLAVFGSDSSLWHDPNLATP